MPLVCNNMAVGSLGSGMTISGEKVSLPDGDEKACDRRLRVTSACSDGENAEEVLERRRLQKKRAAT